MSAIKSYFKEELQWNKLGFEHSKPSDFHLSPWQRTKSSVPLLIFRILLCAGSFAIVLSSMIYYIQSGIYGYWFIYLTHWGLLSILFATGFAVAVSARCHFYRPMSADLPLPWYVKTSWVLYNVCLPLAFLITIFYWTLLYDSGMEEELNHALDVAIHAINSVLVFLLLVSSKVPTRLLHIYHPIIFSFTYVVFNLIYHFAGGTDPAGKPWIYPVIDWANPGLTTGIIVIVAVLLVLLHLGIIGIVSARDAIASKLINPSVITQGENLPLRQQQTSLA